jgi:membrane-bound lytic murein transglycosylase F
MLTPAIVTARPMKKPLMILFAVLLGTCSEPRSLLDEVRALGELRVVTRNHPTTYYTGPEGPEGPEYELLEGFARFLGVELHLQTSDRFTELLPAVERGEAHIAAAGISVTPEREKRVDFGPGYQEVTEHLIYKLGTGKPKGFDDLAGKHLEVVSGTSYVETLAHIQQTNRDLVWTENPHVGVAELLKQVSGEAIGYTIADSTVFSVYRNQVPDIRVAFDIGESKKLAWAFPKRYDRSLIEQAERYFDFISSNGDLKRILDRYYGPTSRFDYVGTLTFIRHYDHRLTGYQPSFRRAAELTGIDWRLLAAIGYQESHWNPEAVSPTGVRGLMMLTKRTAGALGITDRIDPEQSILGGAMYFRRLKERIPAEIKEPDRTWFALAAYNVGYLHLQDARTIVRLQGGNSNRWVDVKQALPLLAEQKWHSQLPGGYARGWEPVQYVENIRTYYDIMQWLGSDEMELEQKPATQAGQALLSSG